MVFLI